MPTASVSSVSSSQQAEGCSSSSPSQVETKHEDRQMGANAYHGKAPITL